jgi:flagellar motor switch protein FliN
MSPELIPHPRALADELAGELATVLGVLAGTSASATAIPGRIEPAWTVVARLAGAAGGSLTLGLADTDALRLSQLVMDVTGETAVGDALRDLAAQAFAALGSNPVTAGLTVSGGAAQPAGPEPPEGEAIAYRLTVMPDFSPAVGIWVRLERSSESAAPDGPASRRIQATQESPEGYPANIDVILDIDLPLSVRFGEAELTLSALTRLGPGSVIDLGRSPDDPVDVLVNGRLVARGEVVVVAGNYGVRILEVVSAADRVRTLGA